MPRNNTTFTYYFVDRDNTVMLNQRYEQFSKIINRLLKLVNKRKLQYNLDKSKFSRVICQKENTQAEHFQ